MNQVAQSQKKKKDCIVIKNLDEKSKMKKLVNMNRTRFIIKKGKYPPHKRSKLTLRNEQRERERERAHLELITRSNVRLVNLVK